MKIPKIGIPTWKVGENSLGITIPYFEYLKLFGEVILINPFTDSLVELPDIDLLIIPGGADINPARYGAAPSLFTGKSDLIKDYFDMEIVPLYIEQEVPIFGICRGFQTLAVMHNYKLFQHMYHETNDYDDRGELVHNLTIKLDFHEEMIEFNKNLNKHKDHIYYYYQDISLDLPTLQDYKCNSLHHQAVLIKDSDASDLISLASYSSFKKTIRPKFTEVFISENNKMAGVQYHPEELWEDPIAKYLIFKLLYKL